MRRSTRACVGTAAALTLACVSARATPSELEDYRRLRGSLVRADTAAAAPRGRYLKQRLELRSSTGLAGTGWLLRPAAGGGCTPAVLLQDGREENAAVIERLPPDFGDVLVIALDYPAEMPTTLRLGDVMRDADRVERAARRIPALFLLGIEYLAAREDVDGERIAIAATSFAVPFASIAAAADARVRNLALVYGAGDLPAVVAANLTTRPAALRGALAWMATRPFVAFAPERFIGLVAPRTVVMVNGIDDPQMPAAAARRLFDAARPPKEIVWLRTGHLMPTDSALIRALVDTAFARLPVLRGARRAAACAATRR